MSKLKTYSVVECSTSHISESDNSLLQNTELLCVDEYEFGFYIWLTDKEKKELEEVGFSEAFQNLYVDAYNTGAKMLILDCDGDVYEDRKQFDW